MNDIKFPPAKCEVGKIYLVPCVRSLKVKEYLPILGHVHEDKEIFGDIANPHWHIDYRFASNDVTNENLMPDVLDDCGQNRRAIAIVIWHQSEQPKDFWGWNISDGEIHYKRLKCKREHPHIDFQSACGTEFSELKPLVKLQTAYCGKELIKKEGEYFCPHRGTKVDVTNVNDKGEIICPAHLLKFDRELKAM